MAQKAKARAKAMELVIHAEDLVTSHAIVLKAREEARQDSLPKARARAGSQAIAMDAASQGIHGSIATQIPTRFHSQQA